MVPEVDLIDSAYLPSQSLTSGSLAKKREELLNRKVGDWNDYIKVKK
jgi:hypothetical protein